LAILGGIALRNGDEAIPSENTHPLVQGVRIIPAPVTESTNSPEHLTALTPHPSEDWKAIATSIGIQPSSERCVDCHFKGQSATQAHPGNHLRIHDPATFGCVLCHGGDSQAIEKQKAHTATKAFPFLRGHQVEATCGKCHIEPAVPGAPYLSGGRFVVNKYGCITCHNLPVEIPVARYAPRLDYTANKVTKAWLQQWLEDPTAYLPESKMPKIEMTTSEREAIIEFLLTLRNDALFQPIAGEGDAENGKKIFVDNKCQSCHVLHGVGDKIGPELEKVGTKVNRLWLVNYLRKPGTFHPTTKMPDYQFTNQQILDVTEYVLSSRSHAPRGNAGGQTSLEKFTDDLSNPPPPFPPARGGEGFKLYISKGCAQCHGITKYMNVNVTEQLTGWDIQVEQGEIPPSPLFKGGEGGISGEAIKRIQAHRGKGLEVPEIDIPESDLELMKVALLAMRQNGIYEALRYNLESGTLRNVNQFLDEFWQFPIPLQGEPPGYYNETVAKLNPESCGSCHAKQWEDWKTTRHSMAMGPGVWGQLIGEGAGFVESCSQCHAPLSEQHEYLSTSDGEYAENRRYDAQLQSQGLACAICHVRGNQRYGPPFSEISAAASVFGEGHHGGAVVSPAYQDSAFCKPCHQFEESGMSLNGKLLENTYNEWLESPHAKNGETCQSCHMPDRRHRWRGIHDPDTVRNALRLDVQVKKGRKHINAEIQLTNVGAGHHLPTYVTPAIFVTARLLGASGHPIPDTEQVRVIQRRVPLTLEREIFDTRIPAGGAWVYTYRASRPKRAKTLEIRIDVHPDDFYNGFFKAYRAQDGNAQQSIEKALENTEKSPYLLLTKQISLE
ncbi:c-type cytochrome, partial [Candidatus Poribacteria bacterium]|nr:c-type cytochrome [Candidatus Poribacteria bacterium]